MVQIHSKPPSGAPLRGRILLVDDDPGLLRLLSIRLRAEHYDVEAVESAAEALAALSRFRPDLVVTDLRMDNMDGIQLLKEIQRQRPGLCVLLLTAHGTIPDAVEATQSGAFGFLTKPVDKQQLLEYVERAMKVSGMPKSTDEWSAEIITRSPSMEACLQQARMVANTETRVLITGESGTGKELLARAIHRASTRKDQPFVAINCSAMAENLLESELFGHVKGAFTGAINTRQGRFELAHKGTLFLDEIGTMSLGLQSKLLRVLQGREFERVGGNETIKVDVRVIAATNAPLPKMISEGAFREDLYYRLNVFQVTLPPLRERREDIPLLIKHFVNKFAPEAPPTFSQGAMRCLMAFNWPGNVRQLENAVERAVTMRGSRPEIDVGDLLPEMQEAPPATAAPYVDLPEDGLDLNEYLASIEKDLIRRALERTRGNRNRAAETLRIKRTTLVEKMKRLGLE